jgi:hypothetical protein
VPGMRYHVKNSPIEWFFEERPIDAAVTPSLLARMLIAKIEDEERMMSIIRSVPLVQNDRNWTCRSWVADVWAALEKDGKALGTSALDWSQIEEKAREYVKQKKEAGRYEDRESVVKPKPTWHMIEGKERIA